MSSVARELFESIRAARLADHVSTRAEFADPARPLGDTGHRSQLVTRHPFPHALDEQAG